MTAQSKTCYRGPEPHLIERWGYSDNEAGQRTQAEFWEEGTNSLSREVTRYEYDVEGRVSIETLYEIPLDESGIGIEFGVIPELITALRIRTFEYDSCELTVRVDEDANGVIDTEEVISYPEWW